MHWSNLICKRCFVHLFVLYKNCDWNGVCSNSEFIYIFHNIYDNNWSTGGDWDVGLRKSSKPKHILREI